MPPEMIEILKLIGVAFAGAGVAIAAILKFGQSWFFKKLDSKYSIRLVEKQSELMEQLEKRKNELNKDLQIDVTHFKSQLDVLAGQKSKFLEKKVNSILELNQIHYLAIKEIKSFTDVTFIWVEEAMNYFHYQLEKCAEELSDYEVYRKIKEDRWPSYEKDAKRYFEKYSECLSLNMPILPTELVEEEMKIVDELRDVIDKTSMAFHRSMSFTQYIMAPEECETTVEECMNDLREEYSVVENSKKELDLLSESLFRKSLRSRSLIEGLLEHNNV